MCHKETCRKESHMFLFIYFPLSIEDKRSVLALIILNVTFGSLTYLHKKFLYQKQGRNVILIVRQGCVRHYVM